jgi:ATP-dependent Zn protease
MAALFRECVDLDVRNTLRVHAVLHTLTSSEHSLTRLADVQGLDKSRSVIQSFIERVTQPQQALFGENSVPRCILLVGPHGEQRRLIAEAVAGEVGTPLLSLAFSKIVTLFAAAECLAIERSKEGGFLARPSGITPYGMNFVRDLFRNFFAAAHRNAPAVLLIEDIDLINRLGVIELRELLLTILLNEIDDLLDSCQQVVVMATVQHTQALDHLLARVRSTNFLDRIVLDQDVRVRSAKTTHRVDVCSSCHHTVVPKWSHCVYCGASLEKVCSRCGERKPNIEGVQFCFECGQTLDT